MKKIYYFDILLLIACLTFSIIYLRNIENILYISIFLLYLATSIYISFKVSKVRKFNGGIKAGPKFVVGSIYLILGKLFFINQIILKGVYLDNNALIYMLVLIMINSLLTLQYTYIKDDKIIKLSGKFISFKNIANYRINDSLQGDTYLEIESTSGVKFRCSLSKKNLELFKVKYNKS